MMHKLLLVATLFVSTNAGLVRVPKIYNALISSDENLSPSHAIPVLEPVLRTTALGVAFPPLFIHPPVPELLPYHFDPIYKKEQNPNEVETSKATATLDKSTDRNDTKNDGTNQNKKDEPIPPLPPQLTYHGSLYPLAIDPYLPYTYTPELLYPSLPYYHQPIFVDLSHPSADNVKPTDPPHPPLNFKKNPDIPDVPPPPLPVKDSTATSTKPPK